MGNGVDVGKRKCHAALLVGGKLRHKSFANTPAGHAELEAFLQRHARSKVHACMEATGRYGEELALFLHQGGHTVSVVNPLRVKAFAESELTRTKTDRVDSGCIARFCATQHPEPWQPPAPELRELQALMRRLDALKAMRQAEHNRLSETVPSTTVRASLEAVIASLDEQIRQLLKHIDDHIDRHPGLREQRQLLETIDGIGSLTAARFLAEVGELSRFSGPKCLAAFLGLSPREHQSGSSVRGRARLAKLGHSRLRSCLYMPAIVAKRRNVPVKALCERLIERGKPMTVVIVAAMRKLVHIAYGVLTSRQPFNPNTAMPA